MTQTIILNEIRKEVGSKLPIQVFIERNKGVLEQLKKCKENEVMIEFCMRFGYNPYNLILHDKSDNKTLIRKIYCMLRKTAHKKTLIHIKSEIGRDISTIAKSISQISDIVNDTSPHTENERHKINLIWNKVKDIKAMDAKEIKESKDIYSTTLVDPPPPLKIPVINDIDVDDIINENLLNFIYKAEAILKTHDIKDVQTLIQLIAALKPSKQCISLPTDLTR